MVFLLVTGLLCLASVLLLLHPVMAMANANNATLGRLSEFFEKGLPNEWLIIIIS